MRSWIWSALAIAALGAGCARGTQSHPGGADRFAIAVTDTGFAPATVTIPAGKAVTLVVTRTTDATCAHEIVFPKQGIRKVLPLQEPVEVALPASPKGEIAYRCGMDMIGGTVVAR